MYSEDDVKQIVDLGFTDDQAKQALVANNYRLDSAIEWLLAGQHNNASASSTRRGEGATTRPRRRRGVFKPDKEAVKNLVEMGFPEVEVVGALELTRNNQQEACAILLGDRQEPFVSTEMYTPLPRDHGLYKLVMERSEIQKALLTPKFLDAMRDLEDKISSVGDFGDDPDIGPILFQISKAIQKYSSTRAAMGNGNGEDV
eukprot:sb/3470680/